MSVPVVIFIYNRADKISALLEVLSLKKPELVYVVSDGGKKDDSVDIAKVIKARDVIAGIDWDCKVHTNYSDVHLGGTLRVLSGLKWVSEHESKFIVLEDDCIPRLEFFDFCETALDVFEHDERIGMICGSNLAQVKQTTEYMNGYSKLINPWGWATWSRVIREFEVPSSIEEIYADKSKYYIQKTSTLKQQMHWLAAFVKAFKLNHSWAHFIQLHFFKKNILAVYPSKNLVTNIGFDQSATTTKTILPSYIRNIYALPYEQVPSSLGIDSVVLPDHDRDLLVAKLYWNFNWFSTIRMMIGNYLVRLF